MGGEAGRRCGTNELWIGNYHPQFLNLIMIMICFLFETIIPQPHDEADNMMMMILKPMMMAMVMMMMMRELMKMIMVVRWW